MQALKDFISKHWKPLALLAITGTASYFGGPVAAELVQELIVALFS